MSASEDPQVIQNSGSTLRRLILLVVLVALAHSAGAGTRVTVAQLDHALTAALAAHRPDAEIARRIASSELSERLTEASLERLKVLLTPNAQATQALALLADRSAFLDPPVAELPGTAAPDAAAQQRILDAARNYVAQTLPRLPDFLATRIINRYDDSPQALKKGAWPVRAGLHLVGTSSREISVRNEREGQVKHGTVVSQEQNGLSTWGEFGFLPALITTDTVKGKVTWSHWEQMTAGPAVVFHYAVPRSVSHYEIVGTLVRGPKWQPTDASTVHSAAAYHGSLWVDPETGAVLRLTLEIGESEVGQFKRVAVMVQYAPFQIGGRNFICPVRSLALDVASGGGNSGLASGPTEWLNVASYSGYHRFASTAVILANTREVRPDKPASANEPPEATSPAPDETASAIKSTTLPESGLSPPSSPLASPMESTPTAPVPAVPNPTVPTPIVAPSAESTPAVSNAPANQPQTAGITLQVNVNRVLVPVVVRDKQGRSVSDLKKEDFQVFDNNKPRTISAFTLEQNGASQGAAAGTASTISAAPPQRFIVLLFDDLHLSFVDLENAKKAGEKVLDGLLAGSNQVAVLSLSGKVASGSTRDRAKLQQAISSLKSQGDYLHLNEACLKMGYVQAWLMEFPQEFAASHNAAQQLIACGASSDPQEAERTARLIAQRIVKVMGRDYVQSFSAIDEVVRRMATLPGQRTLILISPGFEIRDPQVSAAQSQTINVAAQSSVTINTLSPRGLYTTFMTASNNNAEVQDLTSGYAMQDIRVAESSLSDLADGTGGTFIHNSNDLEAGFKALADASRTVYLLELSLDNVKPDGTFHRLKVKVNRDGLQLQARHGYLTPQPEKAKH